VYGIVKQNGGSISVESARGRGSTFRIHLPRCAAEPEPREARERSAAGGGETVLVAEDESAVRRFVTRLLAEAGYRVLEAEDGALALVLAERTREPIHLLVTDVVMPELGGGALATRIKDTHPETRVLYLSGYPDEQLGHEGVVAADAAFLAKPFRADELRERVRSVLDAAR
jgi:DNA-binding response OmpR family regulator